MASIVSQVVYGYFAAEWPPFILREVIIFVVLLPQYTVKNLQFALTVEPDNAKIQQKLSLAQQQRQAGLPTIPSTIEEEMETNPFIRVDLPEIQVRLFFLLTPIFCLVLTSRPTWQLNIPY